MRPIAPLFIISVMMLFLSCDRANKTKDPLSGDGSDSTGAVTESKDLFEGTIETKQELMSSGGVLSNTIEYVIAGDKMSRRLKRGGITALTNIEAGMIIDLKADSVILFQRDALNKIYCKISLKQYREDMKQKVGAETASPYTPYESIFLPLTSVGLIAVNKPDTVTIMKMKCDLLDITQENKHWEIQHCNELKVKRETVELIFYNLPEQAEGFPCIYKFSMNSGAAKTPVTEKGDDLFNKALKALDKALSVITESTVHIKEIKPGKVEFFEKEIMKEYTQVSSLAELEAKFKSEGGGFGD